jgi:hypothetical protein
MAFVLALGLAVAACGGGGGKASAESLQPRLMPASSLPGFTSVAKLDLTDPVDLVGKGITLPQPTYPSAGLKEFQSDNLKGAAGEVYRTGTGTNQTELVVGVAKLGSTSDATKAQRWMHNQDLEQPCYGTCIFNPQAVRLPNVPNSTAVIATLVNPKPSDPANYLAEFTIGQYLYWASFSADSSPATKSKFEAGVAAYYHHAKQIG